MLGVVKLVSYTQPNDDFEGELENITDLIAYAARV